MYLVHSRNPTVVFCARWLQIRFEQTLRIVLLTESNHFSMVSDVASRSSVATITTIEWDVCASVNISIRVRDGSFADRCSPTKVLENRGGQKFRDARVCAGGFWTNCYSVMVNVEYTIFNQPSFNCGAVGNTMIIQGYRRSFPPDFARRN